MLAGFEGQPLSEERIRAYKKVLQENGIPFEQERLKYGDFWDRPTRVAMKEFLEDGKELPEAIVCANDAMAITACSVLNEKGLRVPEDIIVAGFDGTKDGKYHFPVLSTCEPNYEDAVNYIIKEVERIQEMGNIEPCDCRIGFRLSKRQSCGCEEMVMHEVNKNFTEMRQKIIQRWLRFYGVIMGSFVNRERSLIFLSLCRIWMKLSNRMGILIPL